MDMLLLASRDFMTETGVSSYTRFQHMKTTKGTKFWCIVFVSNDPISERLPSSAPSEERYKALKEALQKKCLSLVPSLLK
ncbi:hypothetical protein CY34DRAFT_799256 [Suillus luteus UH-Slu-Lm8-n1]|uniref:Unplaced genomic scaffold CY34scaffold_15, whole genome shotgun sequence n=1 Tax=Suillus luteus UH-Slu-Lm8-n1 TaxID=930992 RepID=A0A0D0BXD6_9AGAM|nr:hypothetical protein CY34DRAFT_799256 [Suillus luteus UH-Slu-Lm8-n1]